MSLSNRGGGILIVQARGEGESPVAKIPKTVTVKRKINGRIVLVKIANPSHPDNQKKETR